MQAPSATLAWAADPVDVECPLSFVRLGICKASSAHLIFGARGEGGWVGGSRPIPVRAARSRVRATVSTTLVFCFFTPSGVFFSVAPAALPFHLRAERN